MDFSKTHGHHGTGTGAGDENLGCVSVVFVESVGDHVGNGIAVATAIVLQ